MGVTMSMSEKRHTTGAAALSEDASAPSGAEIIQKQGASKVYEHVCRFPSPHCSESRSFNGSKSERHTIRNRISALMSKIKMHRTSAEEYSEDTSGPRGTESVPRNGRWAKILKDSDMAQLHTQTNDELQKRVTELRQFYLQQSKELKDTEDRLQKATNCIVQLETEKSVLKDMMHADKQMLQDMSKLVADTHRECDKLIEEREEGLRARHVLEAEIYRMQRHIHGATKIGKP